MRIEIELEVVEAGGGPSYHFTRVHTEWAFLPRVGDHVELVKGALEHGVVGRVVFTTRSAVRLQLDTVEAEPHSELLELVRESPKWHAAS